MEQLVLIIEDEEAYLNLIADCFEHGVHEPNGFARSVDEQGMAISDNFSTLPEEALYEYLGTYTTDVPPGTLLEEDEGWEEYSCDSITNEEREAQALVRQNMKLDANHQYMRVPTAADYPIMIIWSWLDTFDRVGTITERQFMWYSLAKIKTIQAGSPTPIQITKDLWNSRYKAQYDRLIAMHEPL